MSSSLVLLLCLCPSPSSLSLSLSLFSFLSPCLPLCLCVCLQCLFLSLYPCFFVPILSSCRIHFQAGFRKIARGNMNLQPSLTLSPQEEKPKCYFSWKNFGWFFLSQILSPCPIFGVWGWHIQLLGRGEAPHCQLYQSVWHETIAVPARKRVVRQTRTTDSSLS